MRYKTKLKVVEAVVWTGDIDCLEGLNGFDAKFDVIQYRGGKLGGLCIAANDLYDDVQELNKGDYVVKWDNEQLLVLTEEEFKEQFEVAVDHSNLPALEDLEVRTINKGIEFVWGGKHVFKVDGRKLCKVTEILGDFFKMKEAAKDV